MYGFISGFSDTDDIHYCPFCGEEIACGHADGTATCDKCGKRSGVMEADDEESETDRQ